MGEKVVVGVDIGGTKVAAGMVTLDGEIVRQTRAPMSSRGDAAAGLSSVETAIRTLVSSDPSAVEAIGICSPGPLDPKNGVVINPPNLPCWRNFPLGENMRRLFAVPVSIDNDANAAALAEARWGSGRGYRNVFYAGIGTGIGTGIVFDGEIYHVVRLQNYDHLRIPNCQVAQHFARSVAGAVIDADQLNFQRDRKHFCDDFLESGSLVVDGHATA